jgi:hypothetical protein|tara:strand:- start:1903 stop:2301 length:399 start_codon:yes stop_codon:yes gene_type:complete
LIASGMTFLGEVIALRCYTVGSYTPSLATFDLAQWLAIIGFLLDAPQPVVAGAGLVWDFWAMADSAQFNANVTVSTIFLVPIICDAHGWGWAFLLVAPGPVIGAWTMRSTRIGPRRPVEPERESAVLISPYF